MKYAFFSQKNTGQTNGPSGLDLNVEKAWIQGITGDGVVVGVVDDGECIIIIIMLFVIKNVKLQSSTKNGQI